MHSEDKRLKHVGNSNTVVKTRDLNGCLVQATSSVNHIACIHCVVHAQTCFLMHMVYSVFSADLLLYKSHICTEHCCDP